MTFYPIEWPRLIPASKLRAGDFSYLVESGHAPVLAGTVEDTDVAVSLQEPIYSLRPCTTLEGAAHRLDEFKYEIDPRSGKELNLVDTPVGSLIIKGRSLWLAARPRMKMGYALVGLGEIDYPSESEIAFAYSQWRIVKNDGETKHVLYERVILAAED